MKENAKNASQKVYVVIELQSLDWVLNSKTRKNTWWTSRSRMNLSHLLKKKQKKTVFSQEAYFTFTIGSW